MTIGVGMDGDSSYRKINPGFIAKPKPKRKTQVDDLIDYLQRWDHGITSYEAYSQLGITQITARMSEAKKKGYQFRSKWVKHHARNGREVKLKRYWLVVS